jgi:hypothetical protein
MCCKYYDIASHYLIEANLNNAIPSLAAAAHSTACSFAPAAIPSSISSNRIINHKVIYRI